MQAKLNFIGSITTPYQDISECPSNIQANGPECLLNLAPEFADGLLGLEVGQHILILYWFSDTDRTLLTQNAWQSNVLKGTFALRSPHRPNPIAAAVMPIEAMAGSTIIVKGLDCLNGTKLVDIKPALAHEIAAV